MSERGPQILLVANWDSGVGYAWWLMESYWCTIATRFSGEYGILLAYPSVSTLPESLANAPVRVIAQEVEARSTSGLMQTIRLIRKERIRVIYFSDRPTWHWSYSLYRLAGVRTIIVHDHTPGVRARPAGWKAGIKALVHRIRWLGADAAIGATEYVRDRLIHVNCVPPERCFSVPNGLPSNLPAPRAADLHSLFAIPADRVILIMSGRANRYKGIDFILQCMANLKHDGKATLHFVFIGDGPDLSAFKEQARALKVQDYCTFAGRRDDVPALLEGADIAMHPSQGEVGYSLSILEYMRAGLPVVVPDNPSVCAATEHGVTGLIYREMRIPDATAALTRLIDDKCLRRRLGTNARHSAHAYQLEEAHARLLAALETTLAHRKRHCA